MTQPPRDTLNMRIKPEDLSLFDGAAKALGRTRTDFILEAARRSAEEAFVDRLDAPPAPNEKLRRTMQTEWPSIRRLA